MKDQRKCDPTYGAENLKDDKSLVVDYIGSFNNDDDYYNDNKSFLKYKLCTLW